MARPSLVTSREINLPVLFGDFRLLLILFISLRLMLLVVYQPILVGDVERGVSAGGDRQYHFALAELSADGLMPFRDWWSEFPPVWPYVTVIAYQLLGATVSYTSFAMLLGIILIGFDAGVLVLLKKIGTRLHGEHTAMALAWVYALLLAPAVFLWWNFEVMVAFFLLLSLWWLVAGKDVSSTVAMAAGALTKFTPALILGAVWRFRTRGQAARYTAAALAGFVLVYVPLFAQNASMTGASLTAQFGKASYQTVWALLDGNYRTGNFGTIESHFDVTQADDLLGNPAVVPSWVRLGAAGFIGLLVFARTRRLDDKGLVAFVFITLLIFFLQAQGWSPQWLAQIIPLMLLCFPTKNGILLIVILSLLTFAEYPLLFIRTGETSGVITGALVMPFALLVIARTTILVGLCVGLYGKLRQEPVTLVKGTVE